MHIHTQQFLAEDVTRKSIFLDLNAPDTLRKRIEREKAFEKARESLVCPTYNITEEEAMQLVDEKTKKRIDGYLKDPVFQSLAKTNSKINGLKNLSSDNNSQRNIQDKYSGEISFRGSNSLSSLTRIGLDEISSTEQVLRKKVNLKSGQRTSEVRAQLSVDRNNRADQ